MAEIMPQPWPPRSKNGLGTFDPGFNPGKGFSFLGQIILWEVGWQKFPAKCVFFADFGHTNPFANRFFKGRLPINTGIAPPYSRAPEKMFMSIAAKK
jgi:hypothetical protein